MTTIEKLAQLITGPTNAAKPPRPTVVVPPGTPSNQPPATGIFRATERRETSRETPPLSEEAARELKVRIIPRPPPGALNGVPWPSLEQTRAFQRAVVERGFSVPKDVVAALEKLDAPWVRLCEAIGTYSDSAAREAYQQHVVAMTKAIAAGDSSVDQQDRFSEVEFKEDYSLRRQSIKREMSSLEAQASALVQPVRLEYAEHLNRLADDLERPLAETAEAFQCPHKVTPVVAILRKAAEQASDSRQAPTGRPALMLGELLS